MAIATLGLVSCGGNDPDDPVNPKGTKVNITITDITEVTISANVEISDSTAYYCCNVFTAASIANVTDDSLMNAVTAKITNEYLNRYTPEYLVKNGVLFQGNQQLGASGLTPATEFVVVVTVYDVNAKAPTALYKAKATTKSAIDHFQCTCDSAKNEAVDGGGIVPMVYFTITPDDNNMIYIPVFSMKSIVTDATSYYNKCLDDLAQQKLLDSSAKKGKKSLKVNYANSGITAGSEVTVLVAGLNSSAKLITSVQRFDFTVSSIAGSSKPARRAAEAKVAGQLEVPFGMPMVAL